MAYLSPPVVHVVPHHHRRGRYGRGWYGVYGQNSEQTGSEETMYDEDSGDELQLETDYEQVSPSLAESQMSQEYLKARDAHPLAQKHSDFEKVLCNACGGFTLLRDGEIEEQQHKEFCKEGKKVQVQAIDCKKKKTEIVPKYKKEKPAPTPAPEEEEEESSSSSSSSSSESEEETEKEQVRVVEIYLDDDKKIAENLAASYKNNAPFRGWFTKTIDAADGSGKMDVKVTLSTSTKNKNGVAGLQFSLTPLENGKPVSGSTISATLWHLNLASKKPEKRIAFQKEQTKVFKDSNVQHEVLLATTMHVDTALVNLLKK